MNLALYFLACKDSEESDKIGKALLDARLVVCVKKVLVSSEYYWKGKIQNAKEVLLIMDSVEEKFDEIEKVVKKLHSYSLPNLTMAAVTKSSQGVENWLEEGLK